MDVIDVNGNVLGSVPGGDLNYRFTNGIAWIRQSPPPLSNTMLTVADLQKIFPQSYDEVSAFDENGLAVVQQDKKYGLINRKGEVVLPFTYRYIGKGFKGQYIITAEDDSRGVATADGKILFCTSKK